MSRPAFHLLGGPTLFDAAGSPISGGPAQRHRVALLAQLVIAAPNAVSRDRLIGLLWPDRDAPSGRRLLNVAVTVLRQALGAGLIVTAGDDLRLDSSAIDADVHQFERALDEGRLEDAVATCRGAFLEGFFLDDAIEFERWVEAQRLRLARRYTNALTVLAERATRANEHAAAIGWWRALSHAEPTNPNVVLQLMDALVSVGDVTGALAAAEAHAAYMRGEVGVEPDARVTARSDALQEALQSVRRDHALPRVTPVTTPTGTTPVQRRLAVSRRMLIGGGATLALAGTLAWRLTRHEATARGHDLVAVVVPIASDAAVPADLAESVTELLALNLDQADGVRTASASQVNAQLVRTPGAAPVEIGRALHAAAVVSGRVVAEGEVRHAVFTVVDSSGRLLGRASIDLPSTLDSLQVAIDAASVGLLRVLWGRRWFVPAPRIAAISTSSMPALRAFLDGERAFRHSEWDSATNAFEHAAQVDTTFALAYLRLSEALEWHGSRGADGAKVALDHAARHADHLGPRDAELLAYRRLVADRDFGAVAAARALEREYPGDIDAEFSLADIAFHAALLVHISPDSLQRLWDHAIAADPVSLRPYEHLIQLAMYAGDHERYTEIVHARLARGLDSLPTAERLDTLMLWAPLSRARDTLLAIGKQMAVGLRPSDALNDALSFLVVRCINGREDCRGADAALIRQVRQLIAGRPDAQRFGGRWGSAFTVGSGMLGDVDSASSGIADATNTAILGYANPSWLDRVQKRDTMPTPYAWDSRLLQAELALARRDTVAARRSLASAADTLRHDNSNRARILVTLAGPTERAVDGWIRIIAGDTAAGISAMTSALRSEGYGSPAQNHQVAFDLEVATAMIAYRPMREAGVNILGTRLNDVGVFWPMMRFRYAEGLDSLGRRDEAAAQYRRFALVWRNADPPLHHFADEALQRAATLEKGGAH